MGKNTHLIIGPSSSIHVIVVTYHRNIIQNLRYAIATLMRIVA